MPKTIRPQDDFFGYVNNDWLANNPIPDTEVSWGTFYVLRDKSWTAVDEIIKELSSSKSDKLNHDQQLLNSFFASALNYEKTSAQITTVNDLLGKVKALKTPSDIARLLGYLHSIDIGAFWSLYISQDDKDSSNQVLRFYQSGLSLPNRDYYLDQSPRMKKIRSAYTVYYRALKKLLPDENMLGCRRKTRAMEQYLAEVSWTDVELRDVQKNYTKHTLETLHEQFGSFDWSSYWQGLGWENPSNDIVVDQNSFIASCVKLLETSSLDEIKSYLRWKIVNAYAAWLSKDIAELSFGFYGTTLSGQQAMKPLWKRSVLLADRLIIGEALGREYAKRHFPESSKKAVSGLVEEIRTAYHARIDRLEWMSDATKKRAHTKLDNIKVFVGYPTVWQDLSKLIFKKDNVVANIISSRKYNTDIELNKIGKKPADEEWMMNAHTVNAYNHPNRLEIVFPAAILQAPFYSPDASHAANLGGIGAVIGHEFTHGFDDQGSEFDEQGNTNPWQTADERKAFDKLAENIVKQADEFETVPGTFLQGKLILGEAIADIGGLSLAVEALGDADENELKDLFTNFATCECGQMTTERAIELAKTDPHPPSPFRVNNVVNHVDAFYDTYDVKETDKLYLPKNERAKIW